MNTMCFPVLLALASFPQDTNEGGRTAATFGAPVRLMAGDAPMGKGRMFPSPALFDLDGDGIDELYLGDLVGKLTVCLRATGDGPHEWSEEKPLEGADGKALKFNNW